MNHQPGKRPTQISWYGDVPAHWKQMRLKDAVDGCVNGFWGDEPLGDGLDTQVIRVADFNRNERRVAGGPTFRSIKPDQRGGRSLEPGDLLIEKSGGGELQPVGMVIQYEGEAGAVCSNFVARMRPREGVVARYLCFLHAHLYERSVTTLSIKQSTGIQNLDSAAYLGEACFLPPPEEQVAIASYLDFELARIDALIQSKKELLVFTLELRKTAIYEAVFIEGRDWIRSKLKFVVDRFIDTEHKTCPYFSDGKFMVVRTTNIKSGNLVMEGAKFTNEEGFREWTQRAIPQPGDILFTREAPAGEACIVPENIDLCVGQRTVLLQIDRDVADPEFVLWSLYGGLSSRFIADLSRGSTVPHFNMGDIGNIPLCVGPLDEQKSHVKQLKLELQKIYELTRHVESEIELLEELRAATITDAVLGRIDVCTTLQNNKELEAA